MNLQSISKVKLGIIALQIILLFASISFQWLVSLYALTNDSGHTGMSAEFFASVPFFIGCIAVLLIPIPPAGLRLISLSVLIAGALGTFFPYWMSSAGILVQYELWLTRSGLEDIRPAFSNGLILVYMLATASICLFLFIWGLRSIFCKSVNAPAE